jgi:hypothetical protein
MIDGHHDNPDLETAIEVTRKRPIFIGAGAHWVVYIDGILVGKTPKGKTARFAVQPGHRVVQIRAKFGGSRSPELQLALSPGSIRSLVCKVNKAKYASMFSGGPISRPRNQISMLRQIKADGWISKDAISLYELSPS